MKTMNNYLIVFKKDRIISYAKISSGVYNYHGVRPEVVKFFFTKKESFIFTICDEYSFYKFLETKHSYNGKVSVDGIIDGEKEHDMNKYADGIYVIDGGTEAKKIEKFNIHVYRKNDKINILISYVLYTRWFQNFFKC